MDHKVGLFERYSVYAEYLTLRIARRSSFRTGCLKEGSRVSFPALPPLWSYNHHAMVSGIAVNSDKLRALLFNHYVNLRSPPSLPSKDPGGYRINSFEPAVTLPFLARSKMLKLEPCDGINPLNYAEIFGRQIAQGAYVTALADMFFIPEAPEFMETPFARWIIITGYSQKEQAFSYSVYRRGGIYRRSIISCRLLRKALYSATIENTPGLKIEDRFQSYRLIDDIAEVPIDWRAISNQVADYLASRNDVHSSLEAQHSGLPLPTHLRYGISCLEVLKQYMVNSINTGVTTDFRATRLLVEQVGQMYRRTLFLVENRLPGWNTLAQSLHEMLSLAQAADLAMAKHRAAPGSRLVSAHEVEQLLDKIVEMQTVHYAKFIEQIDADLPSGVLPTRLPASSLVLQEDITCLPGSISQWS